MKCSKNQLQFDLELQQYETADFIYVVRFKKVAGEMVAYKDVCTKLLNCMRL